MNWDDVNGFLKGAAETFGTITGVLGEYGINVNGSGQSSGGTQSQPPGGQATSQGLFGNIDPLILVIVALLIGFLILRR